MLPQKEILGYKGAAGRTAIARRRPTMGRLKSYSEDPVAEYEDHSHW